MLRFKNFLFFCGILLAFIACSKSGSSDRSSSVEDLPTFQLRANLSNEVQISVAEYRQEIDEYRSTLLSVHRGLNFSRVGRSDIGFVDVPNNVFYTCPEDYTSEHTVVDQEISDIYFLYEKSNQTFVGTDTRCREYFRPEKIHLEKKSLENTLWLVLNFPKDPVELPDFVQIFRGKESGQLRYRIVTRSENTSDIEGHLVEEIHFIQAVINPNTSVLTALTQFERIVSLKSDPFKRMHNYFTSHELPDRDPDGIAWEHLPVDIDL